MMLSLPVTFTHKAIKNRTCILAEHLQFHATSSRNDLPSKADRDSRALLRIASMTGGRVDYAS